ncbi:phospholipid phosphatase-related protein type 5 isoform X5 [Canis lupus familiaris]|uniref:phospholipid phosphatase-related protein type 5 isoform X5 n=1 Tax=Canis lupus familiaris TaxID=9615 RepID=UPI0018F6720B|nr:phospholipid phosphatase-related protein type 5 isoform X5 [Canis lupus familiaris]
MPCPAGLAGSRESRNVKRPAPLSGRLGSGAARRGAARRLRGGRVGVGVGVGARAGDTRQGAPRALRSRDAAAHRLPRRPRVPARPRCCLGKEFLEAPSPLPPLPSPPPSPLPPVFGFSLREQRRQLRRARPPRGAGAARPARAAASADAASSGPARGLRPRCCGADARCSLGRPRGAAPAGAWAPGAASASARGRASPSRRPRWRPRGPGRGPPRRPAALGSSMLYFQMVIMAGTVMLAYYFEYTDTFSVNVQGFFCHDSAYRKPYPGPEDRSAVPPALLYSLAAGVPVLVIIVGETAVFCLQLATRDFENQEKTILTGDCCYINPLVRRTVRFLGIYTFGLFATDIFVNAGQVVTGNLAPHFLALCKPNYTALGCQQYTQFISGEEACTGNPDLIMRARKTFPSKEAALSVYAAMYLTMYITNTIKAKGTRLAKPVLCLGLMCLAFLTGLNRVAEYRNHWSDVIAGFLVGISIAVFLVVCVVNNFKGRQPENEHIHMDNLAQMPMISIPRVESPLEKNHITAFAEVT